MKDTVSACGEKEETEKKSAGKTKKSGAGSSGMKCIRASSSWDRLHTIVEESEDEDDTDGDEFVDAPYDASWLPDRNRVSREDVWKLVGEFADTLRGDEHFHAETALWENTAEALRGLDRGQIAPVDAMRVVDEVIGSIRQRLNAEEAAKAPSTIPSDLEIVVENMIKDFGPAALRSFLISIAAEMGPYVSGLVSAGMTVPGVYQILRSNANLRNKFFSAVKLAFSSLFTGSFAHAAVLGYLRGFTSDRFEELLGEIDSYGDPMREVLSSEAVLVLMAFLALLYPVTEDLQQRRTPQNRGIRRAVSAIGWGNSLWSWYGWVRSLLTMPAMPIPTTVQLSAGYQDEHGAVFETADATVRDADPVTVTHRKERIGADQRLQSASDGRPVSHTEGADAFASRQALLTEPVTAVALPERSERSGFLCRRGPNPLLGPAASPPGISPYAEQALGRWDRETEQLHLIHFELSESLPCVARFEAIRGVRIGPPERRTWERSCTLSVRDELLSAVRAAKEGKAIPVKLSEEAEKLFETGLQLFNAGDATDAGPSAAPTSGSVIADMHAVLSGTGANLGWPFGPAAANPPADESTAFVHSMQRHREQIGNVDQEAPNDQTGSSHWPAAAIWSIGGYLMDWIRPRRMIQRMERGGTYIVANHLGKLLSAIVATPFIYLTVPPIYGAAKSKLSDFFWPRDSSGTSSPERPSGTEPRNAVTEESADFSTQAGISAGETTTSPDFVSGVSGNFSETKTLGRQTTSMPGAALPRQNETLFIRKKRKHKGKDRPDVDGASRKEPGPPIADPQPFLDPDQKVPADSSDQESSAGGSEPQSPSSPGTYLLNKAGSRLVIAPCGEETCEYMAFLPALPPGQKEARYIELRESQLFFRFQQEDPQNGVLALEGFPDKDSKTPPAYLQVEGDEAAITHMAKVLRGQLPTVMSIYGGEGDLSIELIDPFDSVEIYDLKDGDNIKIRFPDLAGKVDRRHAVKKIRGLDLPVPQFGILPDSEEIFCAFQMPENQATGKAGFSLRIEGEETAVHREADAMRRYNLQTPLQLVFDASTSDEDLIQRLEGPDDEAMINGSGDGRMVIIRLPRLRVPDNRVVRLGKNVYFGFGTGVRPDAFARSNSFCQFSDLDADGKVLQELYIAGDTEAVRTVCSEIERQNISPAESGVAQQDLGEALESALNQPIPGLDGRTCLDELANRYRQLAVPDDNFSAEEEVKQILLGAVGEAGHENYVLQLIRLMGGSPPSSSADGEMVMSEQSIRRVARAVVDKSNDPSFSVNPYDATATDYALLDALAKNPHLRKDKTNTEPAWGVIRSASGTYEPVTAKSSRELGRGEELTILDLPSTDVEIALGPHSPTLDFMPLMIAGETLSAVDETKATQFIDGMWRASFIAGESAEGEEVSLTLKGRYRAIVEKAVKDWNGQIARYEQDKTILLGPDDLPYERQLWHLPDAKSHENAATLAGHGVLPLDDQTPIENLPITQLFGPVSHLKFLAYYKKLYADVLDMYAETPSLVAMADAYMKKTFKSAFGLEIDPRKVFICKFEPKTKVQGQIHPGQGGPKLPLGSGSVPDWAGIRSDEPERDGGYRYAENTASWCISLTELAIRNFDAVDVIKKWGKDGIDEKLGLYTQKDKTKAFGMESRLRLPSGGFAKASALQEAMQKDDFLKIVQEKYASFWSRNRAKYADAQWDIFLLKLIDQWYAPSGNFGLSMDGFRTLLSILERHKNGFNLPGGANGADARFSGVKVQRFTIGTHMASDILHFEDTSNSRQILYVPQAGQSFFEFSNAEALRGWVVRQAKDPVLKGNLLGHFSDAARYNNDVIDATLAGVESMLDTYCGLVQKGMPDGQKCGPNLFQIGLPHQWLPSSNFVNPSWAINRRQTNRQVNGDPFAQLALWAEERMLTDAKYQVKSGAELQAGLGALRREARLNAILPVFLSVPGAIGRVGLIAFGIFTAEQLYRAILAAVTGKTKEERDRGWQAVFSGLTNIVFMGLPLATRFGGLQRWWERIRNEAGAYPGDISEQLRGLVESRLNRKGGLSHEYPASPVEGYALPEFHIPENLKADASANAELQENLNNFHNWKHVRGKAVAKEGKAPERKKMDEILLMGKKTQKLIDAQAKKLKPGLRPDELDIKTPSADGVEFDESTQENIQDRAKQMRSSLDAYNEKVGVAVENLRKLKQEYEQRLNDHFDQILNFPQKFKDVQAQLGDYVVTDVEFPSELKPDARGFFYHRNQWYVDIEGNKIRVEGINPDSSLRILDKDGEPAPASQVPFITRDFNGKWRPRQRGEVTDTIDNEVTFESIKTKNSKYFVTVDGVEHEVKFHLGTCRWIRTEDRHIEADVRTGYQYNHEEGAWEEIDVDLSIPASKASQSDALMKFGYSNGLPLLPRPGPGAAAFRESFLDRQYYDEWRRILEDPYLAVSDDMKAEVLPVLEKFAHGTYERQIDIPLTDAQREDLQALLTEQSHLPGVVTNYKTVGDLDKKNFEVPLTLYRAHIGDNVEVVGLRRSAGAATDPDQYLADIVQHTARGGGSEGRVLSLSAKSSKAASFQGLNPSSTVRKIYPESEPDNFRTAADIIARDGPRLVRDGKITKRTLFAAMDQLDQDEWEVFYVKGDIPASLLKLPSA